MVQLSAKAGEEALGADGLISELWWSRKSRKKKDPEKTKLLQLCLTMVDRRKVEKYPAAKAKSRSLKEISWINQRLKLQRKKNMERLMDKKRKDQVRRKNTVWNSASTSYGFPWELWCQVLYAFDWVPLFSFSPFSYLWCFHHRRVNESCLKLYYTENCPCQFWFCWGPP